MDGAAWEDRALTYNPKADCSFLAALEDWFMSLGVGLLTFASLETIGIYFGLGKWSYQKSYTDPQAPEGRGGCWTRRHIRQES